MDDSERAEIVISGDGDNPVLTVDGLAVDVPAGQDPMLVGIELVATTATRRGHAVPATVTADAGNWCWQILVHADGSTTDDTPDDTAVGGPWPAGRARRRPSRLAVAAIGAVLAGSGVTAVAVALNADHAPGSVTAAPTPTTAVSAATGPPITSLAPPTSPAVAPQAPPPLTPQPVQAAPVPKPVAPPVANVARPPRLSATPVAPASVARRTPAPVPPPKPAAPAGRLAVISDGAGNCVTTANGSAVLAAACTSGAAQRWTATPAGELRQGSRCLVTQSGVAVLDCASVPASARTWTSTDAKPGLLNPATALCLGARGSTVVAAQCGTGRSLRIA